MGINQGNFLPKVSSEFRIDNSESNRSSSWTLRMDDTRDVSSEVMIRKTNKRHTTFMEKGPHKISVRRSNFLKVVREREVQCHF